MSIVTTGSATSILARDALTGQALRIAIRAGVIEAVSPTSEDPGERFIAPTFCDIQINGGLGVSFTSRVLTTDSIRRVTAHCRQHGVGLYLPTVISSDEETIQSSLTALATAIESDPALARAMPGIHLEGPYLSGETGFSGAHPREQIRDPDWSEFSRWQDAAHGRIRIVTLAPERKGAVAFIEKLVSQGVVVALGHTAATGEHIRAAVDAGAVLSTHLGNGCAAMLPRHDNPIWEQLAEDRLSASLIADGHHLPNPILKCLIRAKSTRQTIITCDASPLAGLAPGRYREWGQEFEVLPGGKIVVPGTPYLAGSGVLTDSCISHLLNCIDELPMRDGFEMACINPRRLLNLPVPEIRVGTHTSELILFAWQKGNPIGLLTEFC
ncbi:MAG: N-acetylglucosamine-6-phosphate deacetylase [Gemmataceae bacterium]